MYITGEFKESAKTDIIHGIDNVLNTLLQFISNAHYKIDSCVDYTRPYFTIEIKKLKDALLDAKTRGVKIRYLTEITKDNLICCKQIMPLVDEFRHLNDIKGNFYLSEQEYAAPATFHRKERSAEMIIHSAVREIVVQQQYVFDSLWNASTSAERKIIEIEGDVSFGITEVIDYPSHSQELFINLIKSAKSEILLILPTVNAAIRNEPVSYINTTTYCFTGDGDIAEDKVVGSTGSNSASAPNSSSNAWIMQMATFRASGQSGSNPAPTVSSITPNSGTANGGTAVTIAGTGFLAGATVKLGGTAATGVTVVNSTSITATTPAHAAGAVSVVVTNTDAQAGTLTNGYTYTTSNPAPTVSAISPNSGTANGGTAVTIAGTGFLAGATVKLEERRRQA